jgi:hypothetical protein
MNTTYELIHALAPFIPECLKEAIRSRVQLREYDFFMQKKANPFRGMTEETYPECRYRFGIIEDVYQNHQYYVAACREMGVSYTVIDLLADNWIERFRNSRFDVVLVWPSCATTMVKQVFDYRLRILETDLGAPLYPAWRECWLTEHKPRLRDWLDAYKIPHPGTWVFHDRSRALEFAHDAPLPIVSKTATGASATGVEIVRNRGALARIIKQAFGPGLRPQGYDAYDRQRGYIYLQEYLPDAEEWRMVRIGESYFGYRKEKGPDGLHSGSGKWSWLDPGKELLDLLKRVTDIGEFTSMDIDVFRTADDRLLVNELQTVFGCSTPVIYMKVDDVEGRYLWTDEDWKFEAGGYWRNHMCNLRIQYLLSRLDARVHPRAH